MSPYEDFVINQTRRQYYARTLTDAFRGADYGTAIWRCEKPHGWRHEALIEFAVLMVSMFLLGLIIAPYLSQYTLTQSLRLNMGYQGSKCSCSYFLLLKIKINQITWFRPSQPMQPLQATTFSYVIIYLYYILEYKSLHQQYGTERNI